MLQFSFGKMTSGCTSHLGFVGLTGDRGLLQWWLETFLKIPVCQSWIQASSEFHWHKATSVIGFSLELNLTQSWGRASWVSDFRMCVPRPAGHWTMAGFPVSITLEDGHLSSSRANSHSLLANPEFMRIPYFFVSQWEVVNHYSLFLNWGEILL